jgi:DNA-binding response OmpR family regulator
MTEDATILVVDDNEDIVDTLSMALEDRGYRTLGAADGMEALDILAEEDVDLILADIAMPHLNGYQLYERVRERPEWVAIPFIFLTGRIMDSDIRYGKQLGADDYLAKPVDLEDLHAAVQGRLSRARQLATFGSHRSEGETSGALQVGHIKIDLDLHRVWLVERRVRLSAREFDLLAHLAQHSDRVVSPVELINVTHNLETDRVEAGSLLRPLIRSLRRKLGYKPGEIGCIENVRGVGYRLIEPMSENHR